MNKDLCENFYNKQIILNFIITIFVWIYICCKIILLYGFDLILLIYEKIYKRLNKKLKMIK